MVFYFDVRRFLDIEYRTPNVEVFFPDTLKKNYDEERGRPEMSGRFSFLEGGAHLYIQHHRVFSGAVLRLYKHVALNVYNMMPGHSD
jgi:hypothetical protein